MVRLRDFHPPFTIGRSARAACARSEPSRAGRRRLRNRRSSGWPAGVDVTLTPIEVPLPLVLAAGAVTLLVLTAALHGIQWSRLRDFEAQSVYAAMLGVAVAARLARIELQPGLDLHLFGASAAALMFGWRFALLQQAAAVALVALGWGHFWLHPVLDFVYTGVIPVLLTTALLDFAQKRMPLHLFVYLLFNGFFGGALAIALVQLAKLATLLMLDAYALDTLGENFLLTVPALMFPEGFATGALLTMFVAYRPRWVATFHDASYLGVRGAG